MKILNVSLIKRRWKDIRASWRRAKSVPFTLPLLWSTHRCWLNVGIVYGPSLGVSLHLSASGGWKKAQRTLLQGSQPSTHSSVLVTCIMGRSPFALLHLLQRLTFTIFIISTGLIFPFLLWAWNYHGRSLRIGVYPQTRVRNAFKTHKIH